jgi:exopolysaccharide biosynthesis polyprenyl glycosylphosphotransferase
MSDLRQVLYNALKIFDLASMAFCFFLAASIVDLPLEHDSFIQFLSMRIKIQNVLLFGGFILVWYSIFLHFGIYSSRRFYTCWDEITDLLKATSLGTLALFVFKLLFNIRMANTANIMMFWAIISLFAILSRLIIRYVLKEFRLSGINLRNVVFVGVNARSLRFAQKIETKPELGYRIVGFVDSVHPNAEEFNKSPYSFLGDFDEFPVFIRNNVVDEVVVCLPLKSFYQQALDIVSLCEEQGISVRFLSDLFNLKLARTTTDQFEGEPVLTLHTGGMEGYTVIVKRFLDIITSLAMIIVLSPLYIITALLIKITSPGPVCFAQERLGVNKRIFRMIKFRTMFPDAENRQAALEHLNEASGPVFKIKNDPRITPIGKFLRKASIDELPQLFNVLKGDMSLVGPRPLPVRDYKRFDQDWHRRRFSVRPGITCLWQISGRSAISFNRWMELDMEYIDNWSLWLDLKILLGTIPAVLKGSGAS